MAEIERPTRDSTALYNDDLPLHFLDGFFITGVAEHLIRLTAFRDDNIYQADGQLTHTVRRFMFQIGMDPDTFLRTATLYHNISKLLIRDGLPSQDSTKAYYANLNVAEEEDDRPETGS